jgi:hypothetical protein
MQELTKRVRVVNEDALTHVVDRGVIYAEVPLHFA